MMTERINTLIVGFFDLPDNSIPQIVHSRDSTSPSISFSIYLLFIKTLSNVTKKPLKGPYIGSGGRI